MFLRQADIRGEQHCTGAIMETTPTVSVQQKRGAEDSGAYFRYMSDFVGLKPEDAEVMRQTKPIIEKHLTEIVSKFYTHLLRYPPTRQWFLKTDGSIDQEYLELRMRHLTNFWLRTADALFDDDYARYIDYVGRAHTSHGADPRIYIAERYVIGQVGFVQHAISELLIKELFAADEDLAFRAEEAWDKFMMVLLEMLSRAYSAERTVEKFEVQPVDQEQVERLAAEAFQLERGTDRALIYKKVAVAQVADIPDGERKIVQVDGLSIGVFHHHGQWYALRNSCLHRGGPVCTGPLADDVLTCPWHGFQYNVTNGQLLVDPAAHLDTYALFIENGAIVLQIPDRAAPSTAAANPIAPAAALQANEFHVSEVPPGSALLVGNVAVFNVDGSFYATQDECTHKQGPLSEGELDGSTVTCPYHGAQFNVCTGAVLRGPATKPLATYRVVVQGDIGRVEAA
jgi:nitrite reductase/ring-hydroxylating ferredoxin subunit/hemoglobin-like flavoprotein